MLLRAIDQLDVCHRGIITGAVATLEDANITTRSLPVTRRDLGKQLTDHFLVANAIENHTAIGQ